MRTLSCAVLLAVVWATVPEFAAIAKPDCCKDERHCAMHRMQAHGCRMGTCHREAPAMSLAKGTLACAVVVPVDGPARVHPVSAESAMLSCAVRPPVPPPRLLG